MNALNFSVLLGDGSVIECNASFERSEQHEWVLTISSPVFGETSFRGRSLFDAQIGLRSVLERNNARLLCAGAKVNVFPGRFAICFGNPRAALVHYLDPQPAVGSEIDIFAPVATAEVASLEEQREFQSEWNKRYMAEVAAKNRWSLLADRIIVNSSRFLSLESICHRNSTKEWQGLRLAHIDLAIRAQLQAGPISMVPTEIRLRNLIPAAKDAYISELELTAAEFMSAAWDVAEQIEEKLISFDDGAVKLRDQFPFVRSRRINKALALSCIWVGR